MDSKPSMPTNEDILKRIQEIEDKKESLLEEIKESRKKEIELAKEAGITTNTKTKRPRIKKEAKDDWNTENENSKKTKKGDVKVDYDEIVGNWIDQETKDRKDGSVSPYSSPEPEQGVEPDLEPAPQTPVEPPPIPKTLAPEDKVETIAEKQITGENLTKEELEFYFENRDKIYKAIDQKKYGVVADKLASYDTKNMSDEDVDFYKANSKEIEKLLTGEKMKEGDAIRKERERLERENMKKNVLDTLKKGKEFGVTAINKTKTALGMFGRGGGALTGMSKDMEPEGIYPESTAPKTKEQTETEFELTRRLYFEYSTGSAKFKKESELFKEHALEKEKAYKEARNSAYQQMLDEGRIDEANDFIAKEFELKREHEIKHGSLWTKLKGGASQKIEAWDKWGVDKEGATWDEKLSNWNKRIIKRAINISFIGITSSLAVAGLAQKGWGTASALSGGTFSRLGYKLGWGVTLGTFTEYLMTKIPPNVDAEKAKKVLKATLIGAGAFGATYVVVAGVSLVGVGVGASAAVGYGISKYIEKKGWTEKSIKEKKEKAKNNFNVGNLDDLDKYEKEYLEILKQSENSRIYRKLASTLTAIAGSSLSLEMAGYTKDNAEEIKQVYGNSFRSFWSGVKKWWAEPWFDGDKDSKPIEVNPENEVPEKAPTPAPHNQNEAPKKPEGVTESEPKHTEENTTDKKAQENSNHENHRTKNHVGKKDYSGVHKTWMNSTSGNNSHEGHKVSSNYGAKVGYTEVQGVRNYPDTNENGQHLGYKDYTNQNNARYENDNHSQAHKVEAPERITTEEMADRIYSKNLNMILSTPESRTIWENIKDDNGETNVNTFLTINREDLGSAQIKNLQDYILKVIDEAKLKPQKNESIEGFLSRAFDKASSRPKMLEKLQL